MAVRAYGVRLAAVAVCAGTLAAQEPVVDAGMFRLYQGNLEVLRETFRETARAAEGRATIPLANLVIRWREEWSAADRLVRAELSARRLSTDSLMRSYTLVAEGDSVRLEQADPGREPRRWSRAAVADGLLPEQSVAAFASLVRRAGRRDTTFRVWSASADSALPVAIEFHGDSAVVLVAALRIALPLGPDGKVQGVLIPQQSARAERFAGDSLPPMRGVERPRPDYSAPANSGVSAEQVRVVVRPSVRDTFSLGCTFSKPLGAGGRLPAAITLTGSGLQDRDENLWPLVAEYRPYRQVAERLARAGIAVLRCDDRSFGGSTGRADSSTMLDFADDAAAQLAWLRERPDVNPRRLAIIGHSEGAIVGPMVAARDRDLAALVLMAGTARPMESVVRDQFLWPVESARGMTDEQRGRAREAALRQADAFVSAPLPYLRQARHYDPLPAARQVRQPVLILQGALDRQVSAGQADTLAAAIREAGNRDVTVRVFPRLNHLFLVSPTDGSPSEYPALTEVAVPEQVLDLLADWLSARLASRTRQ